MLWHQTQAAKSVFEMLKSGFSTQDLKLSSSVLQDKYSADQLIARSQVFMDLPFEDKRDALIKAMIGEKSKVEEKSENIAVGIFINETVKYFISQLEQMGVKDEWIANSCSLEVYASLPNDEKQKYHDALIAFHDMKKEELESSPPSCASEASQQCASPVEVLAQGGFIGPDFEDGSWVEIEN